MLLTPTFIYHLLITAYHVNSCGERFLKPKHKPPLSLPQLESFDLLEQLWQTFYRSSTCSVTCTVVISPLDLSQVNYLLSMLDYFGMSSCDKCSEGLLPENQQSTLPANVISCGHAFCGRSGLQAGRRYQPGSLTWSRLQLLEQHQLYCLSRLQEDLRSR
jgi:hypothetical protein